ncbi:MAG: ROK family protein [Lachnoanaerobaculum gingivalis]
MNNKKYTYNNENARTENIKKVISTLIAGETLSRADIAKKFNLNKATISDIIDKLIKDNLIKEIGLGYSKPTGGRKPILLQINKQAGIIFSFEFQYNKYRVMATYLDGELITKTTTNTEINRNNVIKIVQNTVQDFLANPKYDGYRVFGIGIAVHGIVESNKVVFAPYYDIYETDIADEVEKLLEIPVIIENEANLCAIFESTVNSLYRNLIAINISSGIGSGIVLDYHLYKGILGDAGEAGHTTLYPNGRKCRCGKSGCFEQYCSKQALLKEYSSLKGINSPSLQELKQDYIAKDTEVMALIEAYKNNLIVGLGNIVTLFSPEILILKSDIFIEFPDIFTDVKNSLKQYNKNLQVSLTNWKEYSTLFGAIILVLQNYFDIPSFNSYLPQ